MINYFNNAFVQMKAGDFLILDHIHIKNHKMIAMALVWFGIKAGLSEMRNFFTNSTLSLDWT